MSYRVKEIFLTLQGEGAQSGRAAVFLRFSGCNLWDGRPETRATSACRFCDTDFVATDGEGGGEFLEAQALSEAVVGAWSAVGGVPLVVITGGEPLLQLDTALINSLHAQGFQIAVETNGTQVAPAGIDWLCVSPKAGTRWVQRTGHELKLVWPQAFELEPLEALAFEHRFLQPMDDPDPATKASHLRQAVADCLVHPAWRLSLQTHKLIGIA